jgi:hypothetical protein
MYIKLFDFEGGSLVPSIHCYSIIWLKNIMESYPKNYLKIFLYLQYMCSWNPEDNPYLAMEESEREQTILYDIRADFSVEDDLIQEALQRCHKIFDTPTYRLYRAGKICIDNITKFLETTKPSSGKDGSIADIRATFKDFNNLVSEYNKGYKTFIEDTKVAIRGNKFDSQV